MTQVSFCQSQSKLHSVHLPLLSAGGGRLSLQPNLKKGRGLTGPQLLEGGCWGRGGDFFQGGGGVAQLSHNKLKSEIFKDKKSL